MEAACLGRGVLGYTRPMLAGPLRSEIDEQLAGRLLEEDAVRAAQDALAQAGKLGTRRKLLASALRLSRAIAPSVFKSLDQCIERLDVQADVELYVQASAQFNAGCTPVEDGRVFVLVTSALLEGFDDAELRFVLGHELGHHIYDHHAIPLGVLLHNAKHIPRSLVLQAFTWQRHAEISADRAGMLCTQALSDSLSTAARGLFKLSSGLREAPGDVQIQTFIAQAHDLYEEDFDEGVRHHDWLSTHPFSPVRLRAAQVFQRYLDGSLERPGLETECADLLALMEPSYLEEDSDAAEALRRLLFAAAASVASVDGAIDAAEMAALTELLGPRRVPANLDAELLRTHLPQRIATVNDSSPRPRRAQLVRDLALIARADGHVCPEEVGEIVRIARELGIDPSLVEVVLASPTEVD